MAMADYIKLGRAMNGLLEKEKGVKRALRVEKIAGGVSKINIFFF
jgi:hypothetical protein